MQAPIKNNEGNRFRALIIEPSGNLWGSERVLIDFLRCASGYDWEIGVCCPPLTPILNSLKELPVKIFPDFEANLHLKSRFRRALTIIRLLIVSLRFRPHVIDVNQAGATRIAFFVGRILNIPVVTHVRLVEDVEYIKSLAIKTDSLPKVVCVSGFVRGLFAVEDSRTRGRIEMIYDPYTPRNEWAGQNDEVLNKMRLPTVCCVGRLTAIKGQDILLQAVASLKSEGIYIRALVIGSAPSGDKFESELKKLADDLGIDSQIAWMGYQEDVLSHIKESIAQVCPSHSEPLGRVVFEAWDGGAIPIAWKGSGGSAETIQASNGGILYEEQDGPSLANALRAVLAMSVNERQQMIRNGRDWLSSHCNTEKIACEVVNVWAGILEHAH